ncbi:unnamed protein product [Effrenium voratum]|uniref:Uncharacterized protein n=1 Tax=Effrenium voratum TaxID=2562239 RepID=A0AA36IVE7_9DINO|nr:unnamed protein product [Effrenium voratum]CAJ1393598.1 unnamed protein product [Effrenium voratum]
MAHCPGRRSRALRIATPWPSFSSPCHARSGLTVGEVVKHCEAMPKETTAEGKRYAKALYKFVSGKNLRGKWGGNARCYTAPKATRGLGRSNEFQSVMGLARHAGISGL